MRILLLLLLSGVITTLHAQDFGYMGKKNLISFSTNASVRVFSNFVDPPLGNAQAVGWKRVVYSDANLVDLKTKPMRMDVRFTYSRLLNKKIGLGVEMTYSNMRLALDGNDYLLSGYDQTTGYYKDYYLTTPVFNAFGGYLVADLYASRYNAPLGFQLSVGIGPRFYAFDYGHNYRVSANQPVEVAFPDYKKNMMGIHAFVGLTTRKLISSFMAIDYGMRINFGGVFRRGILLESGQLSNEFDAVDELKMGNGAIEGLPLYTKESAQRWLNGETMGNLFSLKLGLTFIL